MKKAIIIIISMILVCSLAGCSGLYGNNESLSISSTSKNNETTGNYNYKFSEKDGNQNHTLIIKEKGTVLVKYDSYLKSGNISIYIKTSDEKIMYENSGKRFSFNETFILDEGLYTITFEYDDAKKGNVKMELHSDNFFEYCNASSNIDKDAKSEKNS